MLHNPVERVSVHVSHRELVADRTKSFAIGKCTTDLSGSFSLLDCRDSSREVAIQHLVSSLFGKQSACSLACFTVIRAFDLSSVLHVEPDPAMES